MIETAVLLSTGDELTTGKVVDTNSTFIAGRLFALGIRVTAIMKVGDDRENSFGPLVKRRSSAMLSSAPAAWDRPRTI